MIYNNDSQLSLHRQMILYCISIHSCSMTYYIDYTILYRKTSYYLHHSVPYYIYKYETIPHSYFISYHDISHHTSATISWLFLPRLTTVGGKLHIFPSNSLQSPERSAGAPQGQQMWWILRCWWCQPDSVAMVPSNSTMGMNRTTLHSCCTGGIGLEWLGNTCFFFSSQPWLWRLWAG